jgi:hypothetical protein
VGSQAQPELDRGRATAPRYAVRRANAYASVSMSSSPAGSLARSTSGSLANATANPPRLDSPPDSRLGHLGAKCNS